VIKIAKASALEDVKKEKELAINNEKNAQKALKDAKTVDEKIVAEKSLKDAQTKLPIAEKIAKNEIKSIDNWSKNLSNWVSVSDMVAKLLFAFYKRDQLLGAESKAEGKVNSSGVTRGRKTSQVLPSAMPEDGTMEDYAAMLEEEGGRSQLMAQARTKRFEARKINREFNEEIIDLAKSASVKYIDYLAEVEAKAKEENPPTYGIESGSDAGKTGDLLCLPVVARMKSLCEAVKNLQAKLDPLKKVSDKAA